MAEGGPKQSELDWIQLRTDMDDLMPETTWERGIRKFKENPFIPVGEYNLKTSHYKRRAFRLKINFAFVNSPTDIQFDYLVKCQNFAIAFITLDSDKLRTRQIKSSSISKLRNHGNYDPGCTF